MLESLQKHWWVLTLRGVLLLIFGYIALLSPGIVIVALIFYFGFLAIFSGIFLIIEGISIKDSNRGIRILEGIFYIIIGLLFLFKPGFVLTFLLYFIAFWAIIAGIFQIYYAIKLRKVIPHEWLAILNGVFTLIFGIFVLYNIFAGALAIVMVFGIYAIISGILMIVLSFRVKSLKAATA